MKTFSEFYGNTDTVSRLREMLARDVWHATARATPLDNVIDVTVARRRRKIDELYERKLLHTVRGVGYMLSGRQE